VDKCDTLSTVILSAVYYLIGFLLFVVGVIVCFTESVAAGAMGIIGGLLCIGLGQLFDAIGKIAANTKRVADSRPPDYSMDFAKLLEATGITNDLLKKLLAAQHAKPGDTQATPPSGEALYYYSDAKMQSQGPFRPAQMKAMARDGRIQSDTPVASAGSEEWRPFGEIIDLA